MQDKIYHDQSSKDNHMPSRNRTVVARNIIRSSYKCMEVPMHARMYAHTHAHTHLRADKSNDKQIKGQTDSRQVDRVKILFIAKRYIVNKKFFFFFFFLYLTITYFQ